MDKEALEALKTLQGQGAGEKGVLSVTVTVCVVRTWWFDCVSPYNERWLFIDGISQDARKTPFYVRAWWPIPLDDLAFFEELDQIPMGTVLTMNSNLCTVESAEDFNLDDENDEQAEGRLVFLLGIKAPNFQR